MNVASFEYVKNITLHNVHEYHGNVIEWHIISFSTLHHNFALRFKFNPFVLLTSIDLSFYLNISSHHNLNELSDKDE